MGEKCPICDTRASGSSASACSPPKFQPIPIEAGKEIAEKYGYDQVIVIARSVGKGGGEHCTTYGRNKEHCAVAARCGDFLKYKVMGWHEENPS